MAHIGLIGGIGPAATELYYRGLIAAMAQRRAALDLTIVHADAATLVKNFEARKPDVQAEIFLALSQRLAAAGADAVAITSIGGHFCIKQFRPRSPMQVIDMIAVMDRHLDAQGYEKVGLIGTDTVMKTKFYQGITSVEVLTPPEDQITTVHRAYVDMALAAAVTEQQRDVFFYTGRELCARGADVILLGGTDLFLAFEGQAPGFETLDCAGVHIDAIADFACD